MTWNTRNSESTKVNNMLNNLCDIIHTIGNAYADTAERQRERMKTLFIERNYRGYALLLVGWAIISRSDIAGGSTIVESCF